jgi:hypothetical protein
MPSTAIICGILLIVIGVIGYLNGMVTGHASWTALIPALIGVVLYFLGRFAGTNVSIRKNLMHVAVIVALLGFLAVAGRMLSKFSELTLSAAVLSQAATALVCLVFVVLSVKSFIDARRNG